MLQLQIFEVNMVSEFCLLALCNSLHSNNNFKKY